MCADCSPYGVSSCPMCEQEAIMQTCPDCEGLGGYYSDGLGEEVTRGEYMQLPEDERCLIPCHTCRGTGEVEADEVEPPDPMDLAHQLAEDNMF